MDPILPLAIVLPPPGSGSRLASLHQQLRAAILDGRLKAGLRLPATRALATTCGVSRNTAVAAYDLLQSEGYVTARRGSGTVVAATLARPEPRPVAPRARRVHPRYREPGPPPGVAAAPAIRCSFAVGVPDLGAFPYDLWRRLAGRVTRRHWRRLAGGADPQGLPELRAAIAAHVSFARAVACTPADVLVTAGAQQAFDLIARVLMTGPRPTVAVEDPGYPGLRLAFDAHGAALAPVPVDGDGLVVERVPASARVVCVTPSHQFPIGAVMSMARRTELLEHCRRHDAVVVEDDYDGEFRFTSRPLEALQTLDRHENVFYVGTFSKSLVPDVRLGYVVAPPWALRALVAAKLAADGQCSALLQATVALLIREGHLARHVRKMQRRYDARRRLLLDGLSAALSRWLEPLPSIAGLHVTARLRGSRDETALVARAAQAGVAVQGLGRYYSGRAGLRGLVLGYGNTETATIPDGLERLRRTLEGGDAARGPRRGR